MTHTVIARPASKGARLRAGSYLAVLAFVVSIGAAAQTTITLSAKPGEAKAMAFGGSAVHSSLSATLRLTNYDSFGGLSPKAHVGFSQADHRHDGRVEFFVIGNRETGHIVAGYRLRDRGQDVKVELLEDLPLSAVVKVTMKIDNGLVTLDIPPLDPITIQTSFTAISRSAFVNGASLEATVAP